MSFAIIEPDAGSNSHRITTTARRDPDGGRRLSGTTYHYISRVDGTAATLVVALDGGRGHRHTLAARDVIVPTDTPGMSHQPIERAIRSPEPPACPSSTAPAR
jgi:alkylation response protein AidB-like acyl-CoA dehydrogenase